ncbi:GntR family transcriptional regulator of abcA and norABC [Caldalkalibacillus uzonensis]|uniref:GntR family transcriptional regulator of abcA and norABC n=1 Tax=Caldalkalibacillus uzonensis TaxID=353224 RepID=A0ABU0CV65_9BACI|nr:PLP-dependent aminotransferase family protein [Caldalkalibacillus uzonensis]MDQ0339796.1 GntR family transcriptional regulator of abcA and norABC [Caldalkalibacillus uzonensis]
MAVSDWKPDRHSPIPLHKQIEEHLKEKIMRGEWTVGTKIPSQRALAKAFGVNRSTVVTALDELAAQGLLKGNSGGGTRVVNHTWNLLASTPPPDWGTYVKSGMHQPNLPTIQEINQAEYDPHIIRLGTGELAPDLLPAEHMQAIFQHLPKRTISLGYEQPKGDLFLREQLVKHLREIGIDTSPSSILIVSGGLQALQLISIGLLHRGSTVLLEKPSYLYSVRVFQSAGMKLLGVPLDKEGIQPAIVSRYKRQYHGALLYTIPSFHNPTGTLMTDLRRRELLKICTQERLPVIEDDVYRDLWLDAPPPPPLKACDQNGLVLYMGSMSKTLSPGLRIGWVVGPEPVIDRLADIKMQTDYGSSSLSQWAVAEWLASGLYAQHIQYVRKQLKLRREIALQALETHFREIAQWSKPQGGFYIWLKINVPVSIRDLFERALAEGILLNPGHLYDRQSTQYLRLSYAYAPLQDLEDSLARLADLIKSSRQDRI